MELPIALAGSNCTPHAIGEGKRNHLIEVWVRVASVEALRLDVDITDVQPFLLGELCDVDGS